jgi:hypothetical protein
MVFLQHCLLRVTGVAGVEPILDFKMIPASLPWLSGEMWPQLGESRILQAIRVGYPRLCRSLDQWCPKMVFDTSSAGKNPPEFLSLKPGLLIDAMIAQVSLKILIFQKYHTPRTKIHHCCGA